MSSVTTSSPGSAGTVAGSTAARAALPARALYEQVAERLRARILAHEMAPGSWIDEQSVALELGISRTPLREALKVLASEGLVAMRLRRGAYVAEVTRQDLADVYHLLALLEADAAAAVAGQASQEQLDELATIHRQLEAERTDRDAFFAANERFHVRVLQIAGNRWREQMVADLRKVMKLNRHQSLQREGRIDASLAEHREVLAAIVSRDSARARAAMQHHIGSGYRAAVPAR